MSKCDLLIVFDRDDRTYRGGEEVAGTVHVRVNRDVHCDGLLVEHFWQTHGQGNTATGPKQTTVLFRGDWQAGATLSYPFRFRVPNGPPTYHGHYLNVDHYISARVDVPWAIDPKLKEEYILLPGGEYGNLPRGDRRTTGGQQFAKYGVPIGIVMIVIGVLLIIPFGLFLIPIGVIILLVALRKSLAEKKIGKVNLRFGSLRVAPGDNVPVQLSFTPRQSANLNGITAKLVGMEQCVSGSGTNRTTHTHKLHERTVTLARGGQLTAGEPIQLEADVRIPKTNAFSFSASDNELIWSLEVRVDIPLWPDWVEKRVLTVRPVPVAELVEEEPAAKPAPTPAKVAAPAPQDLGPAGMTVGMGSEITMQQAPDEPPPVERPVEAPPPVAEQPPVAQQPPAADTAAADRVLMGVIERLAAASSYGRQREEIIAEHTGQSFPCSIEIDHIERTYTYIPDKRFRDGRTVTGVIRGTDCEVSVQLPEERNGELESLGSGDTLRADCTLLKWNNIHDRLEMREA